MSLDKDKIYIVHKNDIDVINAMIFEQKKNFLEKELKKHYDELEALADSGYATKGSLEYYNIIILYLETKLEEFE